MGKKIIIRNIFATFFLQLVTIVNGLVIPKIFISLFGSEANGLVTSINQFLNYVTLLEGGLSGVVMASLYKPLRENNQEKISAIFNATQHFFKQIGCIYVVYAAIVAFVYPLFVKTAFSYAYVVILVLVLAINLFTQYFFSITYQILIRSAQQVYIVSLSKAIIMLLNILLVFLFSKLLPDLILIKALSAIVLFLQPLVFYLYTKKHFKLDKKVPRDNAALSQRWSGFGHVLAYFINTNISVIMLTVFSTLPIISVYSVYLMVTNAIRNLAVAIASALVPALGNVMAKDDCEESNRAFNIYEFGMGFFTTLLFTCGIILIVPFVKVYTADVTDADYIQPVFATLLMLAEMIYCFREPYINAAYAVGHYKQTTKFAYIEVGLNVVISFILVHKFNLIGVALGLLVAMIFRMIAHVLYLKNNILNRPLKRFFKIFTSFFLTAGVLIILANLLLPLSNIGSYLEWFVNAIVVFVVCLVALLAVSFIFFRDELKKIIGKRFTK